MKTNKIPIYYIDEEMDMDMLVEHAVNSTVEENISRYFEVLDFNFSLAGIDIYNHPMEKRIYFIDDESK
jgi:hypothetical protein